MPDTPGTGPTDPEDIARAISAGAEPYKGHLRMLTTGEERWLAVLPNAGGGKWATTITKGVGLGPRLFDAIARGKVVDGYLHVDGSKFAVVPPRPGDLQMAKLEKRLG